MRRAPVVIGATVVGLIGVLTFHTKSAPINLGSLSGTSATQGSKFDHRIISGEQFRWCKFSTQIRFEHRHLNCSFDQHGDIRDFGHPKRHRRCGQLPIRDTLSVRHGFG